MNDMGITLEQMLAYLDDVFLTELTPNVSKERQELERSVSEAVASALLAHKERPFSGTEERRWAEAWKQIYKIRKIVLASRATGREIADVEAGPLFRKALQLLLAVRPKR